MIFTDWSIAGPHAHYYYFRGAIWGFVVATLIWKCVIPWLQEKIKNQKSKI